mmetsp:Transcript_31820/g.101368  ORF Transcript_31820/g.101368 Transcript_31820/m.101368 type:complete len:253 (-) Transcript_31820:79-837(-)
MVMESSSMGSTRSGWYLSRARKRVSRRIPASLPKSFFSKCMTSAFFRCRVVVNALLRVHNAVTRIPAADIDLAKRAGPHHPQVTTRTVGRLLFMGGSDPPARGAGASDFTPAFLDEESFLDDFFALSFFASTTSSAASSSAPSAGLPQEEIFSGAFSTFHLDASSWLAWDGVGSLLANPPIDSSLDIKLCLCSIGSMEGVSGTQLKSSFLDDPLRDLAASPSDGPRTKPSRNHPNEARSIPMPIAAKFGRAR